MTGDFSSKAVFIQASQSRPILYHFDQLVLDLCADNAKSREDISISQTLSKGMRSHFSPGLSRKP